MKTKLLSLWESVHTSFWFLPTVMAIAAVGLSVGMVRLDRSVSVDTPLLREFLYPGGAEGARLVLSTIAGSMITVAGVTFSITIVALTLASSQFGPRLLRSFMADKGNQVVLGTFVGTFSPAKRGSRCAENGGRPRGRPRPRGTCAKSR